MPDFDRLQWGIRESFRDYIRGVEDGAQSVSGAATQDEAGVVSFPAVEGDYTEGSVVARFTGAVSFRAHGGVLGLTIADPWVEARGVITIAGPRESRVPLAEFDPAESVTTAATVEVHPRLSFTGSRLFDEIYGPGAPLDAAVLCRLTTT
jgi:hypothetical protein